MSTSLSCATEVRIPLRRRMKPTTAARQAEFLALIQGGASLRVASREVGINEKYAASYVRDLIAQGINIRALLQQGRAAAIARAKAERAAAAQKRLGGLLREHLAARRSLSTFVTKYRVSHRTVCLIGAAEGLDLPKAGPRPMLIADRPQVPPSEAPCFGACSQIVFKRHCPTCGGMFERAGLTVVVCDPCGGAI